MKCVCRVRAGEIRILVLMDRLLSALALAALIVAPAFSQSGPAGPAAPAAEATPAAGMAKTSGVVIAVDAAAGTLKLKDKAGMTMEFKIGPETKVMRAGKTLKPGDIAIRDKVRLLRYDRRTHQAVRIELAKR